MNLAFQIAQHFRHVFFGGNWTSVNLKEALTGVDWQLANKKIDSTNSILALTYHIQYYVHVVLKVLKGGPLDASDKFSWQHPEINSQEEWDKLVSTIWGEAEEFAALVDKIPDSTLEKDMADPKYDTWYRNLQGIIEHTHYHLGQIVILKKLMTEKKD
jgi:uncharacterized damage-inducible protein DinB